MELNVKVNLPLKDIFVISLAFGWKNALVWKKEWNDIDHDDGPLSKF